MSARRGEAGFTLIEALAALAATAAILATLGAVAGQWLPHWRHGFRALQNADLVANALDRMVQDIGAAQYARIDGARAGPLFRGDSHAVAFVREAIGPEATPRLEVVRIGETATPQGVEAQRAHAAFAPGTIGEFRDAATLLRPPFRLEIAYAGPDRQWRPSWNGGDKLPRAVRLTVRADDGVVVASTALLIKVTAAPEAAAQPQTQPAQAAGAARP